MKDPNNSHSWRNDRKGHFWRAEYLVAAAVAVWLLAVSLHGAALAQSDDGVPPLPDGAVDEHGHYAGAILDLIDDAGRRITQSALALGIGDTYINRENDLFEVVSIEEGVARVANRGRADMPDVSDALPRSGLGAFAQRALELLGLTRAQAGQGDGVIGIYHTHSAESYEPTSGTAFKDDGDVFEVGRTLAEALEAQGYQVVYSDDGHLPHDAQAYQRSRRTAADISRERPVTMVDVHRDAIPNPDDYRTEVEGEQMTAIRLVVGRQNQNRDANLEYAKRIKAIADEKYPGLVKGIFHARGNYNQDLGPRMILMEFGTHRTTLEEAQQSARLMAEVLPAAAGLAPGTWAAADSQIGGAAMRTIWWILGLAVAGGLGWLWLNREGLGLRLGDRRGNDGEG